MEKRSRNNFFSFQTILTIVISAGLLGYYFTTPIPTDNVTATYNPTTESLNMSLYESAITSGTTGQYWRGDKTWQTTPSQGIAYEGTTQRANPFPIFKSASVSTGTAVMYLTADNTSGGTTVCPNGVITDSVNAFVSDAAASYQMSYAFTNSNKTLTVTANKLTTANILTGILGQGQANGASVKVTVWCY